MANIELSTPERAALAEWLRERIAEETGEEIGGLEAESLLRSAVESLLART